MISLLLSLFLTNMSFAEEQMLNIGWGCDVRAIVESPKQQEPKADVLFLIGFSDRADNHGPLFSQLTEKGFRVISFDYPSHGKTKCRSLGVYDLMSLARLTRSVLQSPGIQSDRPLYVSGWSTGGLLVYRMMQQEMFYFRDVKGLVLLAPGLAVYKIPGDWGVVTQESLLSNPNPPHRGEISPSSPLLYPLFGTDLIAQNGPKAIR
ncbi:alpha/beta fold hydrolase [bacterium]|nr:alpha/beta fold hydrolase [bacterium]